MNKQKAQRREELLEAAQTIINEEGYEACTVRGICAKVGVSPSSFYHCFADKDEVVFAISNRIDEHFSKLMDAFKSEDPRKNLEDFILEYLSYVEKSGRETCWRIHISHHDGNTLYSTQKQRSLLVILERILFEGRDLWYGDLTENEMVELIMTYLRGLTLAWAQKEWEDSLLEHGRKKIPAILRMVFKEV